MPMRISGSEAAVGQSLSSMLSIYTPVELIAIVENLMTSTTFLTRKFFPNEINAQTPEVAIDIDVGKRRLAPFCSPLVEGKPVESRPFETRLFKPPYIKDLRNPDLLKPVRRMIGETIGKGFLTPMERLQANLIYEVADQMDMIDRRCEWMAAEALTKGSVVVEGDGYPATLIDYRRDPSLTFALTGDAMWGKDGVSPADCLEDYAQLVLQKSGAAPTDVIFTPTPWQQFSRDSRVTTQIFQKAIIAAESNEERARLIETGGQIQKGGIYKGTWGQFNLWLYNEWYVDFQRDGSGKIMLDATGKPIEINRPMIQDGQIVMTGAGLDGTRANGQIIDPEFSYQGLAYAPKLWVEKNPAQINLLMQSAPIMIPSRVNASLCATVTTPGNGVLAVA